MPAISLFGLGIAAKSPTVTAKLMTNFYAEQRPAGEKSVLVAHGTPGLELFCDVEAPARGALEFEKNATAFVVAGATLWEIDGNGVKTNRGALLTTSGRVSMAHNGVQIMMVDGFNGYIYNTVTLVFAQITDSDFPAGPQTVCYLSRRFVINVLNSSRFYVSDIDDGLSWDALDFANAESNPDPIIAVWASTGQLVLLGANTTEFWGNSGTLDFPFTALQGSANEWGMDAVASIAKFDNTFAWLVRNRMGQVMVAQMNGYLPKKISTIDIDHIVNAYVATSDAVAYSYMLGGHPFYVISFPSVAPAAPAAQAGEAAAAPEVVLLTAPVPPDPMPNRVLYLGVDSTVLAGDAPITTLSTATKWVWTAQREIFVDTIHVAVVSDVGVQVIANLTGPGAPSVTVQAIADIASLNEVWVLGRGFPSSGNRRAHIARFSAGTAAVDGTASVAPAFIGWAEISDGVNDPVFMDYDPVTDKVWIAYAFSNIGETTIGIVDPASLTTVSTNATGLFIGNVSQFLFASPSVAAVGVSGTVGDPNFVVFNAVTYAVQYSLEVSRFLYGQIAAYDSQRSRFVVVPQAGMTYTMIDAVTGATTTALLSLAAGHDTVPPPNDTQIMSVTYYSRFDLYVFGANSTTTLGSTLYIVDPDTLETQSTYTFETGAGNLLINTLWEPLTGGTLGNYVLGYDLTHVKRLYIGTPGTPEPEPGPGPTPEVPGDEREGGGIGGGPVNQTWLYDGSTGFWSKLKSFGIDRHRVQFSYQCAGQTIGADYANGKQYRITDTALSDNGESIEGEIIGETLALPDQAFLTVNKVRVSMETGVGTATGPGSNPQVSLSIARDSGAKQYGPEMWRDLGRTGEFYTRLEWRRLGTTRYFTVKLRVTDPIKRVITGASVNASD